MRPIKFRAWDETNKVMEYNVNINQGKAVKQGYQWFNTENTVHDSELMQYTGLTDRYGREIYEGDVILFGDFDYDGREFPCEGEVVFEDGCYHVTNAISESELFNHIDEYVEVIGNIYEDKHLLEVQE